MSKDHYTVMIAGKAKFGMEDYIRRNLIDMMNASKQQRGCITYNIHESLDNPGEFMVYMVWENKEAFDRHNERREMIEFREKLADEWFERLSPKTYWRLLSNSPSS